MGATLNQWMTQANAWLWHANVLYALLGIGLLFTLWSRFCQYRALTHGLAVIRGQYDDSHDPGAISHFQALTTALSATVGLGNISGVALAIALGGPGAVFWMWVAGFLGMAFKTTEVTLSMIYRNTDDQHNPHGGPMWVARRGLAAISPKLVRPGQLLAGFFCVTLLISTVTGGNFFQAWSTANITEQYLGVPAIWVGVVLSVVIGLVIIGGISRIGSVTSRIVPFMCAIYLMAALYVLFTNLGDVPAVFALIFSAAFSAADASGAFVGGAVGTAFSIGLQRAFFSNEAGQGSSAIAHCAARTDEPAREGLVAGLEPLVDTLVICTLTALVILLSGIWNRGADIDLPYTPDVVADDDGGWTLRSQALPSLPDRSWRNGEAIEIHLLVNTSTTDDRVSKLFGTVVVEQDQARTAWASVPAPRKPTLSQPSIYVSYTGATLTAKAFDRLSPGLGTWVVLLATWLFAISTMISWSYYGEQGVIYLFGDRGVLPYRVVFCMIIPLACAGWVNGATQVNNVSLLGAGVMLLVNVPITLLLGHRAMAEIRGYLARMHLAKQLGDDSVRAREGEVV